MVKRIENKKKRKEEKEENKKKEEKEKEEKERKKKCVSVNECVHLLAEGGEGQVLGGYQFIYCVIQAT